MSKWGKAKILLGFITVLAIFGFSINSIDPLYLTKEPIAAVVTRSIVMLPRYGEPYNKVVVQLDIGELHTLRTPVSSVVKEGSNIKLHKYQRSLTGVVVYKLNYSHE